MLLIGSLSWFGQLFGLNCSLSFFGDGAGLGGRLDWGGRECPPKPPPSPPPTQWPKPPVRDMTEGLKYF